MKILRFIALLGAVLVIGVESKAQANAPKPPTAHRSSVRKRPPAKKPTPKVVHKAAVKPAKLAKPLVAPKKPLVKAAKPVPTPTPRVVVPKMPPPVIRPSSAVGQMGSAYLVGGGTLTLEKAEFTDTALPNLFGPVPPDPGTRYVVFTVRVHNTLNRALLWSFEQFHPTLRIIGGEGAPLRAINLMTENNNKFEKQPLQSGETKVLRFHFQVPQDAHLLSLSVGEGTGTPQYVYDLSGVR